MFSIFSIMASLVFLNFLFVCLLLLFLFAFFHELVNDGRLFHVVYRVATGKFWDSNFLGIQLLLQSSGFEGLNFCISLLRQLDEPVCLGLRGSDV